MFADPGITLWSPRDRSRIARPISFHGAGAEVAEAGQVDRHPLSAGG